MQKIHDQPRAVGFRLCRTVLFLLGAVPALLAQTGGVYDLTWHTNDGGGTTSAAGGAYTLGGTAGQSDAGSSSGGAYALTGGFWGIANQTAATPPVPSAVVSRKLHGGVPFDIALPLTGNVGIECRSGGANNDYQIVFSFPNSVTFANASVTAGTGSVSGSSGSGTSTLVVNLTSVTNAQRITVTLSGASDGTNTGDVSVQMGILLGDTTGNGSVNASDVSQTKSKSGQAVDATNFRTDVTVSNSINASDVGIVKSKAGTSLP